MRSATKSLPQRKLRRPMPLARRVVLAAGICSLMALASPGRSQDAPLPASLSPVKVRTEVVNVYAVVKDRNGRLVPNLGREDFQLKEDNVLQEIRYFTRETDTPLTLGILIDTSPSQGGVLSVEQEQARAFVRQVLRSQDLAFVMQFDREVELIQGLTNNMTRLIRGIDESFARGREMQAILQELGIRGFAGDPVALPWPGTSRVSILGRDLVIGGGPLGLPSIPMDPEADDSVPDPTRLSRHSHGDGATQLYDAVYLASNDLLKNEAGRKVIILLSDGIDDGSRVSLKTALDAAHRAEVIIYSIAFDGVYREFYKCRESEFVGHSALESLSDETGGRVLRVRHDREAARAFQEIAEELRTQYSLGYTPSNRQHDGSYRKIRVQVRGGGYKVQARRGYYAPSE